MLVIVDQPEKVDFSSLFSVYSETISASEMKKGTIRGQTEFITSWQDFLSTQNAYLGIWQVCDTCASMVRFEPYRDGYIFSWLETMPQMRNNGAAKALIDAMTHWAVAQNYCPIYCHIDKRNFASIKVFTSCGFSITGKPAVFLDGSVYSSHHTLRYDKVTTTD